MNVAIALLLALAGVMEPPGYWTGAMQGATPATLAGATVVDLPGVERLIATARPILVDVAAAPVRPAGMPGGSPWLPIHRSIPGSHWLPGAGNGNLSPATASAFVARIETLAAGDADRPVVIFCHPHCWASWNAARRLVLAGHHRVFWFPGGMEAWQDRHDTDIVPVDPAWRTP